MSTAHMTSSEVKCPYWHGWIGKTTIRCEGFVDGTEVRFDFGSRQARKSYRKAYCERAYRLCPLCRACEEEKYGED